MAAENRANFEKCDFLPLYGAQNVIFCYIFIPKCDTTQWNYLENKQINTTLIAV